MHMQYFALEYTIESERGTKLMRKLKIITGILAAVVFTMIPFFGGCTAKSTPAELNVVTSTSLISQIVERIGGDNVDVINIIPPAQCPGHFDVKPGDIQKLTDADLFLMHGWQGEKFSQDLIASAGNTDLSVVTLNIKGNWMTPAVQEAAIDEISTAMIQADPDNSSAYEDGAAAYKNAISAKQAEVTERLSQANLSQVNVMCADQQMGFVSWTGLNVVDIFGRPETMTIQIVKDLVDEGRAAEVTLIIDNLQSGQDAGKSLAEDLGATRIILSNFPGGFDDTETWEKAIDKNIDLILDAVSQ